LEPVIKSSQLICQSRLLLHCSLSWLFATLKALREVVVVLASSNCLISDLGTQVLNFGWGESSRQPCSDQQSKQPGSVNLKVF
jgi:hypothetical protein